MSYSFTIRGATKEEAKRRVADELAKVVEGQPSHAIDCAQAQAAADAFINLMPDDRPAETLLQVSVHGYVGWTGTPEQQALTVASVGVTASVEPK